MPFHHPLPSFLSKSTGLKPTLPSQALLSLSNPFSPSLSSPPTLYFQNGIFNCVVIFHNIIWGGGGGVEPLKFQHIMQPTDMLWGEGENVQGFFIQDQTSEFDLRCQVMREGWPYYLRIFKSKKQKSIAFFIDKIIIQMLFVFYNRNEYFHFVFCFWNF